MTANSDAQQTASNDSIAKNLSEVVIKAKREIHTDESDVIYLSEKNRRFGTNALDAVSSLRQFSPVINGMSLTTADQKEVAIMINGRPATPQDLRGYTGKEIKQVTYYPVAPPRYSDVTDGPLIDVIVKVNRDYVNVFLSASHSVNAGFGTDQAVVRWADSLNMLRADYFIDYRNLIFNNKDSYIYPATPMLNRDYSTKGKYRGHYQYGKVSWQNTAKDNFLHLSAMFTHTPGNREYLNRTIGDPLSSEMMEGDGYSRFLESNSDIGSINFFYRRKNGKGRLDFQANGSVGKTSSENYIESTTRPEYGTDLTNHTYMAYGKLMYHLPVNRVNLFFSGSYRYQHIDHDRKLPGLYKYDTDRNTVNLSAAVSGKFARDGKRLNYTLGLAMNYQSTRGGSLGVDLTHCRFTPYITLSSPLSERIFVRLRGYIKSGVPGTGELSDVLTYQENNLAWRGDPSLKGWTMYGMALQPEWVALPGKLSLNGDFSFQYTTDPIKECVYSGSPVEVRYVNLSYLRNAEAVLFMSITPVRLLTLKPYFQWSYNDFSTPSRKVEKGYLRYGGSVSLNTRRIQSVVAANCPYKTFNGDVMEYGGWQLSCSVLAKLPANLALSLEWRRSYQNDRTEIHAPGILDYVSKSRYPRLANQITVGLTWSFSHGILKKRQQLQVEDAESDSGISDFNKAQM
ncbi:MAG: hypothetical protein K2G52_10110 [Muribaculaceae bacterium]|nr:hypothetical protein [Muribaculaceae bacterium]